MVVGKAVLGARCRQPYVMETPGKVEVQQRSGCVAQETTRGKNKKFKKKKQMHNLEGGKKKKKGASQNKGSSPSCPCQEGSEGHNSVKWFLPTLPWVAVHPGGTDRNETSPWEGSYSHSHGAKGTRLQVFLSARDTLPKACGTAGDEVHAQT